MWVFLGWAVAIGLPLVVIVAAVFWPERISPEKSVDGIRARIEDEERRRYHRHWRG